MSKDAIKFLDKIIGEPLTFRSMLQTIIDTDNYTIETAAAAVSMQPHQLQMLLDGLWIPGAKDAFTMAQAFGYPAPQFVRLALQAQIDLAKLPYVVKLEGPEE